MTAMNEQQLEELLTRFTNSLRVAPLDLTKPEDEKLYVSGLHGDVDAVARLRREILRVEGGGVFLFTGQPGSGKSTELQRLRRDLLRKGCQVFYCDLEEWLNFNAPVTLSSFLVALLSSWVDQVGTLHAQRTPAERFITFLTKTRLIPENLKLDAAAGPIKGQIQFALKTDEDFRRSLEENLKRQLSSIVTQARQFIAELVVDLCPGGEKCVLLADSIEKIRGFGDESDKVYESVQRLFVSEGSALRFDGVHVVYSVSPFLLEQNTQMAASLGMGVVVNMPSVHVFERHSRNPDEKGLAAVIDLIARRFPEWSQVLAEAQLRRLVLQTGGDLRDLLRAIRIVLTDDIETLPVTDDMVEYALKQITPSKAIPAEHVGWLARLDVSHEPELSDKIDGRLLQRYLTTKHVLVYLNGEQWYAVHPMLCDWVGERAKLAAAAPIVNNPN